MYGKKTDLKYDDDRASCRHFADLLIYRVPGNLRDVVTKLNMYIHKRRHRPQS